MFKKNAFYKISALVVWWMCICQIATAFTEADRVAAWSAWTNAFYFVDGAGRGYFRAQEGSSNKEYFWQRGTDIEVVNRAVQLGYASPAMVNALCQGFTNDYGTDWSWDTWNDDVSGLARAFVGAYEVTGNTNWLLLGKYGFDLGYSRGYEPANGGVYEYVCTTNCLEATETTDGMIIPCYLLGTYLPDPTYTAKAQALYSYLTNYAFVPATGMVEGTPNSGVSSTAPSDYGFFIQEAILYGSTNYALLANNYLTNHWPLAASSGSDGSWGICLRGISVTGVNIPFAQQVCDNAWSWRNSRNLSVAWTARLNDTNALNCYDAMQLVMGMFYTPTSAPLTLPVSASDVTGGSETFSTTSIGGSASAYQWQVITSGVTNNISGATNATLTLSNLQLTDSGWYQLWSSNSLGIIVSVPAVLIVSNAPVAVSNLIVSCAAQIGAPYGNALTPSWQIQSGDLLAGISPKIASGNFNLNPYYASRSVNSLTTPGSLTLSPQGTSTNYERLSVTFTAASTLQTITFLGTDLGGGDNTVFIDNVQIVSSTGASVTVPNGGFETPNLGTGGFRYNPSGGSWTFSGASPNGSGIAANGSIWGNINATEGSQAAFIQGISSITQTIAGFTPGVTYTLSFSAVQRGANFQTWTVKVNSVVVGSFGAGSTVIPSSNYVTCGGGNGAGSNLVYQLTGAAYGYDLTNISVYGGWVNDSYDSQAYTVSYSTASDPNTFIYLGSVNYNSVNTNYNPLYFAAGTVPAATRVSFASTTGILASNVAALKFDFTAPVSENGYSGYARIAAYGSPSGFSVSTVSQAGTANTYPFTPNWSVATNGDLILWQSPATATGNFSEEVVGRNVDTLTSGGSLTISQITGSNGNKTTSTNYVTCGNGSGAGSNVIYTLSGSPNGYDVTNITVYGGWQDNGRDAQAYTIYYSTATNPTNFTLLTSVNYNPSVAASTPSATRVEIIPQSGSLLIANAAAIKFDFTSPASENGYCGYAQIAVYGTAATVVPPAINVSLGEGGQFVMNLNNLAVGNNYTVQSTTNLASANWITETNFNATSSVAAFTNQILNSGQKFYRALGN